MTETMTIFFQVGFILLRTSHKARVQIKIVVIVVLLTN